MLAALSSRLRWQALAALAGMCSVLAATLFTEGPTKLNFYLEDLLLRLTTRQDLPSEFVLVAIDQSSMSLDTVEPSEISGSRELQLMAKGYPWSREVYASLARKLFEAGARLVIFDLLFSNPREGDDQLASVLEENRGRIVLASSFERARTEGWDLTFLPPTPELLNASGHHAGFVNLPPDVPVVRWIYPHLSQPGLDTQPSLATVAATLLGATVPETFDAIRFCYSRPHSASVCSLYEIFVPALWQANFAARNFFRDKVVLVGATAEGLKDYHRTPFERLSGPEIHLHFLASLLRGQHIVESGQFAARASIPLAALACFLLLFNRISSVLFIFLLIAGVVLWLVVCALALEFASTCLPIAPPVLAWLTCGFTGLACNLGLERRERTRMRRTLERYVSRDVVREIVDNPASYLQALGGQRKQIVALFSDLQGFTAESERIDAGEMVALLNEYFGEMVQVVFERNGTLDKFMGDALMATWGCMQASTPQQDAQNALAAALEMKERLAGINRRRTENGNLPWDSGIGICQGPAIFGNIGSQQKMEPTVIGDTVNLASRIESLTRVYACGILVDERIAQNASGEREFLLVDIVRVKGKRNPEKLFLPLQAGDHAAAELFVAARRKYLGSDFLAAAAAFAAMPPGGRISRLAVKYYARCEFLVNKPPAQPWDGIWDFVEK